jgi:hypothetical protein
MIDLVEQIDLRLREFQRLTGKGNIKDCHQILYEIIRLMMALLHQRPRAVHDNPPVPVVTADVTAPYGFTNTGAVRRGPIRLRGKRQSK